MTTVTVKNNSHTTGGECQQVSALFPSSSSRQSSLIYLEVELVGSSLALEDREQQSVERSSLMCES